MSNDLVVAPREPLRLRHRPAALCAVTVARLLSRLPPYRISQALGVLRRGADPAGAEQTARARAAVITVSRRCASHRGCLQRSLATAVLCRMRGVWPTWCTGVRTQPFRAHAWVSVDGEPVGEPHPADYYTAIMTVPPLPTPDRRGRGGPGGGAGGADADWGHA
ncbi:lasso peptide biosynthesis B2 protein [Streptacidiphilus sp. EB129]|uniref:lasso peptide biosynthesis B2 protein n=1 Tax=Streptacidiphilus sp. EB129 TaxID=3156262 RepID=UPI0035175580